MHVEQLRRVHVHVGALPVELAEHCRSFEARTGVPARLVQLGAVRPLDAERTALLDGARREAERADIAAHLHDSVLQTLTLIRKRADEPGTVARLARSQERELRAWLYTDRPAPGTSVADAFTDLAGEIEGRAAHFSWQMSRTFMSV